MPLPALRHPASTTIDRSHAPDLSDLQAAIDRDLALLRGIAGQLDPGIQVHFDVVYTSDVRSRPQAA